jgi:hypothetical protein
MPLTEDQLVHEAQNIEKQNKEKKTDAAKQFDPSQVLADAAKIHVVNDAELGEVKYGKLTRPEVEALAKLQNPKDRAFKMIFAMLHKGYPDMTEEQFNKFPFETVVRLSEALSSQFNSFLGQKPAVSKIG